MTIEKVVEAIKGHDNFLITAHINLEGDSLGSQLAMRELLVQMGKRAFILDSDPVPEHYKFLPKADQVLNKITEDIAFDTALVLDCPTLKRTGKVKDLIYKRKPIINIDHHISNEKFGDFNWIDPNASSAGEMVYRLFKETGAGLTKEIALCLYIAILTDTGSFNYENTSSVTHEIVSELLGYGLEPALVSESVYEKRQVSDIRLLGLALSAIRVNDKGDVAYLEVTREMVKKTGADVSKTEGLVNYARSIENVKIAMLFKEGDDKNKINISFRSKGDFDVNKIASAFGGGGHVKAAGCVVEGSLAEVEEKVLAKVEEALGHGRNTDSR